MGAPKQKWTPEEEEALRAGIAKHGAGKWKTILTDPEYTSILSSRSNVDLKDKWRNINVFSSPRDKSKEAVKRNQQQIVNRVEKPENNVHMIVVYEERPLPVAEEEPIDPKPADNVPEPSRALKKKIPRLDNLVLEAITSLKEPRGSNKSNISTYIEDRYDALPDFRRVLSETLNHLAATGKVMKVNHKYRIAPPCASSSQARSSVEPLPEGRQTDSPRTKKVQMRFTSQSQVDAELEKIKSMTAQEAASAAARAVAEAEAALAEAEQAEIDALAAEADAEEAQAFAEAALMTLKNINTPNMMVHA